MINSVNNHSKSKRPDYLLNIQQLNITKHFQIFYNINNNQPLKNK